MPEKSHPGNMSFRKKVMPEKSHLGKKSSGGNESYPEVEATNTGKSKQEKFMHFTLYKVRIGNRKKIIPEKSHSGNKSSVRNWSSPEQEAANAKKNLTFFAELKIK